MFGKLLKQTSSEPDARRVLPARESKKGTRATSDPVTVKSPQVRRSTMSEDR